MAEKTFLIFFVCLLLAPILKYYLASRRPRSFPPGPPTLPVLGNLHQLPKSKAFLQFHEWSKTYGSIVGLKFGSQNVVVLNNWRHARELFDKRGAKYSSRPDSYVGNDLICPNQTHILLVPYGQGWRVLRKAVNALLNVKAVTEMLPIQNAEASQTMYQLLHNPADFYNHIRRYSTAVILASVYGQRGAEFNSPKVQALYHAQDQFTSILAPGATPPVDAFPILRYVPKSLAKWKNWAETIRKEQRSLYFDLMQETKDKLNKGAGTGCFMERLLHEQSRTGLSDDQIAYLGGILMEAGSDTTSSTLLSCILGMLSNPKALETAQRQVDEVCGTSRSPTWDDLDELPYIRACMNESLRWRPVAPGGIPHMLTEDDTYEGYILPKGTVVFANAWSIHRDGETKDPDSFVPERFLDNKFGSKMDETESDSQRRATYAFGAGRRVCPGQTLAENSLMLNIAKIVWGFDFKMTDRGIDWDVGSSYSDGFVFGPNPFAVGITPRSPQHRETIEREFQDEEKFLQRFES